MREIYFDNSATTCVCEEAAAAALRAMREDYGNPSALYGRGVAASRSLKTARETMLTALGGSGQVIFTGCGSESNNTILQSAAQSGGKDKKKLLISAIEHPSVTAPAQELHNRGYELELIPVGQDGLVELSALEQMLDDTVALVSVMHVNNETGAIQPLAQIGAAVRRLAPRAVFHIDGVQSFGRLPVTPQLWQADAFSASGHKIHAPKGIGLLWLRSGLTLQPLIRGGGQEKGLRSGTENMPGILGLEAAVQQAETGRETHLAKMRLVRETLLQALSAKTPDIQINSPAEGAPHILNLSFLGCRSEVLLHYLESMGICVSAGSACNSRSSKGSKVLTAMKLSPARIDSALRFSFCRYNTEEEALQAAELISDAVAQVRALPHRR